MRMLLAIIAIFLATAAGAQLPPTDSGSRPVPDPTTLTTQQLDREIESLTKLVQSWREGDAALFMEKFNSIADVLLERDKAAVAAAAATATAVGKTEDSFARLLNALDSKLTDAIKTIDGRMAELRDWQVAREGQSQGSGDTWAGIVAAVALGISSLGLIVAAIAAFAALSVGRRTGKQPE